MWRRAMGTPIESAARRCESVTITRASGSDAKFFRIPFQSELARRRHISDERGGRDDRRARKIAFAAQTHPVLPVSIERRDRALAFSECVGSLTEAGTAP